MRNEFIRRMETRLTHLPEDQKRRIVTRVMEDVDEMEVLVPSYLELGEDEYQEMIANEMHEQWELEEGRGSLDHELDHEVSEHQQQEHRRRNERVLAKQKALGIDPEQGGEVEVPRCEDIYGRTKLHLAVTTGDVDAARKLIREGENVTLKDNGGNTAITLAALNEDLDMIQMFTEEGVMPDITPN